MLSILNFSHPVTPAQKSELEALEGRTVADDGIKGIAVQLHADESVRECGERIWTEVQNFMLTHQPEDVIVILPGFSPLAAWLVFRWLQTYSVLQYLRMSATGTPPVYTPVEVVRL